MEWQEQKDKIAKGLAEPFVVAEWREARKKQRRKGDIDGSGVGEDEVCSAQTDEDEPLIQRAHRERATQLRRAGFVVDDDDDDDDEEEDCDRGPDTTSAATAVRPTVNKPPTEVRRRESLSSDDSSDLSNADSLLDELTKEPVRKKAARGEVHQRPVEPAGPAIPTSAIPDLQPKPPTIVHFAKRTVAKKKTIGSIFSLPPRKQRATERKPRNPYDLSKEQDPGKPARPFQTVGTRYRFQKYAGAERVPDIADLEKLIDSPAANDAEIALAAPTESLHGIPQDTDLVDGRQNLGSFNPDRHHLDAKEAISEIEDIGTTTLAPLQHPDRAAQIQQDGKEDRIPMTCPDWHLVGSCQVQMCPFRHQSGFRVAYDRWVPPKYSASKPLACWHWAVLGRCHNSDEDCNFAHWPTDRIASRDGQESAYPWEKRGSLSARHATEIKSKEWDPKDRKSLTCAYWYNGGCRLTDEKCKFAHWNTGWMARLSGPPIPIQQNLAKSAAPSANASSTRDNASAAPAARQEGRPEPPHGRSQLTVPPDVAASKLSDIMTVETQRLRPSKITCYFWYTSSCKNGWRCAYLHELSDVIANPPPSLKPVEAGQPIAVESYTNANTTPLGPRQPTVDGTNAPPIIKSSALLDCPSRPPPRTESLGEPAGYSIDADVSTGTGDAEGRMLDGMNTNESLEDGEVVMSDAPMSMSPVETSMIGHQEVNLPLFISGTTLAITLTQLRITARGLLQAAVSNGQVELSSIVTASDAELFLEDAFRDAISHGEVHADQSSADTLKTWERAEELSMPNVLDRYTQFLISNAAGAFAHHHQFTILFYPVARDLWTKLLPGDVDSAPGTLRYILLPPIILPHPASQLPNLEQHPAKPSKSTKQVFETIFGMSVKEFLDWPTGTVALTVFLMFPKEPEEEVEILTKVLQDIGADVFHANTLGSWDYFTNVRNSGVVLIHPSICDFAVIPGLAAMMHKMVSFYHVSYVQDAFDIDDRALDNDDVARNIPKLTLIRLFPNSEAILITDSVFYERTDHAIAVMKSFFNIERKKPHKQARIVTRPGIRSLPYDIATTLQQKSVPSPSPQYNFISKLVTYIDNFIPDETEDPMEPGNPGEDSQIISVPEEEMEEYLELWNRDKYAADEYLATWFAGWACLNAHRFRRFTVIHTAGTPDWQGRWQHLTVWDSGKWIAKYGV